MATRTPPRSAATPAPAPRGRAAPAAEVPTIKTSFRGAAGMRAMEEEQVRSEAMRETARVNAGAPFRFFVTAGETREIVIVDEAPDFWRYEHNIQNPKSKKWDTFLPCIDTEANCPVCENAERPAYFAMYLTIIDLKPYPDRDGNMVDFSKKLLVVKPMQQKKITRLYERHKSLRGMVLSCSRDTKTDAAIGDMEFVEFMDEEELLTYQSSYTDKERKVHDIDCSVPFDYEAIFPDVTEHQLRAMVGGRSGVGSREDDDAAIGRGGRTGFREADDAPAPRRAARTGRAEPEAAEEEEEEEAPAPRRGARSSAPVAPTTTARRQAIDPDDNPEVGDDDEEPPFVPDPPRRGAPAATGTATGRTSGRVAQPASNPRRAAPVEEEEEDVPQRPARGGADVSARRASLRRT